MSKFNRIPTVETERPYRERAEQVANTILGQSDELDRLRTMLRQAQDDAAHWENMYNSQVITNESLRDQLNEISVYKEIQAVLESELTNLGMSVVRTVQAARQKLADARRSGGQKVATPHTLSVDAVMALEESMLPKGSPEFLNGKPVEEMTSSQKFLHNYAPELNR